MDIAVIRHFQTEWNKKGLLQGKRDIPITYPLSPNIRSQMIKNRLKLEKLKPFDYVFTSELERTKQTAKLYGYENTVTEPLLNELDFGTFEGKRKRELVNKKEWMFSPLELKLGESLYDFQKRLFTFLEKYKDATSILIFGHGSWTRALLSIQEIGNIQNMNKITVKNNELITLLNCKSFDIKESQHI